MNGFRNVATAFGLVFMLLAMTSTSTSLSRGAAGDWDDIPTGPKAMPSTRVGTSS